MKEIFIYIVCETNKFYITDRGLDLAQTACPVCDGFDEFVGSYTDDNKLKKELEILFSAYDFYTSDSCTELIPLSVFREFKNPAEDMVVYLKGNGMLD